MLSFDMEEEEEADEDEDKSDSEEEKAVVKKEASDPVSIRKRRFGKNGFFILYEPVSKPASA